MRTYEKEVKGGRGRMILNKNLKGHIGDDVWFMVDTRNSITYCIWLYTDQTVKSMMFMVKILTYYC
jgi:hypothetical protein